MESKEHNKTETRLIDSENKPVVVRGEEGGETWKIGEED